MYHSHSVGILLYRHDTKLETIHNLLSKEPSIYLKKTLSFTLQHRRSTKTLKLHYGLEGMKYIFQVYEGEINGHGEKVGLPTEFQYEFEQEMLKHIHDLRNELREKGWMQGDSPEISQTSFLRGEDCDAELGFKFE